MSTERSRALPLMMVVFGALLAALAVMAYRAAFLRMCESEILSVMRGIRARQRLYYAEHGRYSDCIKLLMPDESELGRLQYVDLCDFSIKYRSGAELPEQTYIIKWDGGESSIPGFNFEIITIDEQNRITRIEAASRVK